MGTGIAQVAAQSGFKTILFDLDESVLTRAREQLLKNFQLLSDKKRISSSDLVSILEKISFTSNADECIADCCIEAIIEKPEPKISLLQHLAMINDRNCILTTNTSSLSVSAISKEVPDASRVAGMHFFNPAPLMKLVEIVRTAETSDHTLTTLIKLAD